MSHQSSRALFLRSFFQGWTKKINKIWKRSESLKYCYSILVSEWENELHFFQSIFSLGWFNTIVFHFFSCTQTDFLTWFLELYIVFLNTFQRLFIVIRLLGMISNWLFNLEKRCDQSFNQDCSCSSR